MRLYRWLSAAGIHNVKGGVLVGIITYVDLLREVPAREPRLSRLFQHHGMKGLESDLPKKD